MPVLYLIQQEFRFRKNYKIDFKLNQFDAIVKYQRYLAKSFLTGLCSSKIVTDFTKTLVTYISTVVAIRIACTWRAFFLCTLVILSEIN